MSYRSPPIVEAVFDLQFEVPYSEADIRRTGRAFLSSYPKSEENFELQVEITTSGAVSKSRFNGLRLTNVAGDELVIINSNEVSANMLAPYQGWEKLEEVAWANFGKFNKIAGARKLRRIAVRFINRIDIPGLDTNVFQYVNLRSGLPEPLVASGFSSVAQLNFGDCKAIINHGAALSPLLNHQAYTIDIDMFIDESVPQREEDLRNAFKMLRHRKNELFETLITDSARALFEGVNQ